MITLIRIIILAISAIFVLSWLYPAYWNWAVMPVEIIFPSNIVLLALAVILAIIPRLGRILLDLLSNAWEAALSKMASMPGIVKLSLWVIIPAVFFYLIRSQSLILGDGELILGRIVEGELISSTAFGYSQLVSLLAELFRIENLDQAANLMAALSIICGVVYTYFLYKTASLLVEDFRMRLWLFLIVLFSGLSVIFAGYVETYPILIAWLVIYFHSVVESMKYKSSVFIPAGILVVGLFWHIWFLAFLPSILWLINHRYKLIPNFVTFIISVLYIVAIYIAGTFISRSGIQTTLPLLPDETTNYFLFSPTHLIDFANVLIIAGPVLALLALAFLFYPAVYKKSHYLRFLLWAAVPAFLVSFMIDPVLGAPRDWDLLSIYSLPLFLFAALFIAEKGKSASKIYSLIIPILILNLIQFSSFAAMNMQSAKSLDRITRLAHADPHYQIDYYEGRRIRIFAHLLSYVYKRHQASVEFMEKMADAGQLDCLSGVSIANGYINMEEYETAR
ncbi:MAG: hypothetical protein GWO41_17430, partial [candidate division Zixibacteria bacterium]|nr:hypothetical protein [candidate division Zixibacteria bacterium]NIR64762.1 hypothetical protein [candidate division Zixibacteria bacterium]NIS18196.1 hypothetical protein [candidate division Zixibacteria bacterium]NIS46589.1 hypothetical protein [candidate division Zixibacteria bacterium]NIT54473.1 hypothetical protein [candidate division Zixibacteria bacterium]